jgi:hypothetical protein
VQGCTLWTEPLENPEGEIDLDAIRIEDLAVEFVRQSFDNQQLVDWGAPARSGQVGAGIGGSFLSAANSRYLLATKNVNRLFIFAKVRRHYLMGIAQWIAWGKGLCKYTSTRKDRRDCLPFAVFRSQADPLSLLFSAVWRLFS